MNPATIHRSTRTDWETPPSLFKMAEEWIGRPFTLDACAQHHNAKVSKYFTPEEDGLAQDWTGEVVWCNPEYLRWEIGGRRR